MNVNKLKFLFVKEWYLTLVIFYGLYQLSIIIAEMNHIALILKIVSPINGLVLISWVILNIVMFIVFVTKKKWKKLVVSSIAIFDVLFSVFLTFILIIDGIGIDLYQFIINAIPLFNSILAGYFLSRIYKSQ